MDHDEIRERLEGDGEYVDISDEVDPSTVVYVFRTARVALHLGVGSSGQIQENGGTISRGPSTTALCSEGACAVTQNAIHAADSGGSIWTFPLQSIESFGYDMTSYRKEGKTLVRRKEKVTEKCQFSISFLLGGRLHEIESAKYEDYAESSDAREAIHFVRGAILD